MNSGNREIVCQRMEDRADSRQYLRSVRDFAGVGYWWSELIEISPAIHLSSRYFVQISTPP